VAGEQKGPHDDFVMAALVIFVVGGLLWIIWHLYHEELTNMLRWIRVGELHLASLFVDDGYGFKYKNYGFQSLEVWREYLPQADVKGIDFKTIDTVSHVALIPLKLFFTGMFGLLALWALLFGPGNKYKRKMGLPALIEEQAKMFPVIAPFVKFNPGKLESRAPGDPVPSKLPMFSEALAPEEWVAHHGIKFESRKLDFVKTYEALAQQLGERWQGPLKLPIHAQALYATFALKHVRKRDECVDLLGELALAWSPEKGFRPSAKLRSRIRKIIKNPKLGGKLTDYTKKHAYQTTAMLKALSRARQEGGVIASAEFVWLRGYDRNLWYPLNNLGRKSYHAEAAGAMAHYVNELIAGQKIPSPRFEDVIKNIEETLVGDMGRPIPKRKIVK